MKLARYFVVLIVLVLFAGCSGKVSLKGKVTFSDDNTPLTKGTVCFTDGITLARGELQSDGSYVVSSESVRDGIKPGKYQVYISGATETELRPNDLPAPSETMSNTMPDADTPVVMPHSRLLIDPKYTHASTSDLSVEVSSSGQFDFQVERFTGNKR